MNIQGHLYWALKLLQFFHDAKKHLLALDTQTPKMKGENIQKLFLLF